ncbi:hypothetical protein G6F24_003254 [Rhizopus arrhizus]|nr:hypothetical protein G6F24_003254 [Rhizopus arrhizus]
MLQKTADVRPFRQRRILEATALVLLEAAVVRFFQIEYVAVGPSDRSSVPDLEPAVILVYPCFGETDFRR